MNMQDPISDMLTRIRNGQITKKNIVCIPYSKIKENIISLLKEEGYVKGYKVQKDNNHLIQLELKYFKGKPVIEKIQRISRPGLRIYKKKNVLPSAIFGMGIVIISTSKGIMTDHKARKLGVGGEVICQIL